MQPAGAERRPGPPAGHVLVVAGGDVPPRAALDAAWPGWLDDPVMVIAADSGWTRARALDLQPDLLVGDLDSLDPAVAAEAEAAGVPILRSAVDKDESDTELALVEAVRRGATRVTVLGALGGSRLDHALANVWLLAHPALGGVPVALLDAQARVTLLAAPDPGSGPGAGSAPGAGSGPAIGSAIATRALPGPIGALVSLFPFGGDAEGITTHGLRYPLADEPLRTGPARGLSNVRTEPGAAVSLRRGRILIVEGIVAEGPARVSSGA